MNAELLHEYRRQRQHQINVYLSGGGSITRYPSKRGYGYGKVELSYASAPYGEHALSAFIAARRHLHFLDNIRNSK